MSRRRDNAHGGQDDQGSGVKKHDFLNKGVVGRYREVMSPQEQALCRVHLAPYLEKMGYLE